MNSHSKSRFVFETAFICFCSIFFDKNLADWLKGCTFVANFKIYDYDKCFKCC